MDTFKKLKIHGKFRLQKWGSTTVPAIRIEGKWLEELGFKQGQQVNIQLEANKLTITLDSNHTGN
jgi:toxic protein SymE